MSIDDSEKVQQVLSKLNSVLPLSQRQQALPKDLENLHRKLLYSLASTGKALSKSQITRLTEIADVDIALSRLKQQDLVIVDVNTGEVTGAYPMTTETTPHQLLVEGIMVNAMCAVDALSVAPVFNKNVEIRSSCHVTGARVVIKQSGKRLISVKPVDDLQIGIRWQSTRGCAAHSLCMEMVFLWDESIALDWQGGEVDQRSLLSLDEAIALGTLFFSPLLQS